jgi:two-component system chemotaxis response regulator CheY
VIVTDLNMPVMDGFTFIEKLRARPQFAKVPIIVLTTEGAATDQVRARELGVETFVTKPIRPDDLLATVKQLLGSAG